MRDSLQRFLNVQTGEGKLVFLLFAEMFLLGTGFNFIETSVFPLFLNDFSAASLPYIYIINAIVVALCTGLYLRLGRHLTFAQQLMSLQAFLVVLIFATWLAMVLSGGRAVVFSLPILFQIVVNLGQMAFWTMTGRLLNLRQSKRLFGVVGAGMWVAIVLTGFLIPLIVRAIGTVNLLFLSSLGMAAAFILLVYITRRYQVDLEATGMPAPSDRSKGTSNFSFLRNRYVVLIFSLTLAAWLSFFFVDNIFFNRASAQFPTQEAMSSFMGIYLAALGIFTLFNNLFLVGFVINRFGVRAALLVLPVSLLIVTLFFTFFGTVWGIIPLLFWLATLNRVLDLGLFFSVDQSAQAILYQPMPAAERTRIQTIDNGIVQMSAVGLAGGLLILLNRVIAADVVQMAYVLLVILVAWLVVAVLASRAYPHQLLQALTRRRLSGVTLSLDDSVSIGILKEALHSQRPGSALYALGLLADSQPEMIASVLPDLLAHPAAQVRLETLRHLESLRPDGVADLVQRTAGSDPDARVRGAAWRALPAVGGPSYEPGLLAHLADSDPHTLEGVIVGLRNHGQEHARSEAGAALRSLVEANEPARRQVAVRVLDNSYSPADCDLLAILLRDDDQGIRRHALQVAGKTGCDRLWPIIIEALKDRRVRQAATGALIAVGEPILPILGDELNRTDCSRDVVISLSHVCGRIGGSEATKVLLEKINHPDDKVRSEVLAGLSRAGFHAPAGEPYEIIRHQIETEVHHAGWLLAGLRDCTGVDGLDYLNHVLRGQFDEARNRIYLLLSFIVDREAVLQVRESLLPSIGHATSEAKRAYAMEVLELRLPADLKRLVMPLAEELPPAARLSKLSGVISEPVLVPEQRVIALVAGDGHSNHWLLISAIHAAGRNLVRGVELGPLLEPHQQSPHEVLSEIANWTAGRLNNSAPLEPYQRGKRMLTTIEKVILLKDVELFSEMPDELLAEVAGLLAEVEVPEDGHVFGKGEVGDSLYIVVSGQVRVHDGDFTINLLGESEVFGEMALLDPETRMASVTAAKDSLLLRLEQESFFELIDTRSEVARGIIRVLSSRLRQRVKEVAALSAGVTAASPS